LKLVELGPRLRLKLVKVERGMASGDVMYHAYVHKTPEEIKELKDRKEGEIALKVRFLMPCYLNE
jgi:ribosome biogenesis protein SSF1/2